MNSCMFCRHAMTGKGRAREHVLKKEWLTVLNHLQSPLQMAHLRGDELVGERRLIANQFLTGAVCSTCNNNWMNDVDAAVSDWVLGLAQGSLQIADLPNGSGFLLSRWLLKTACCLAFTDKPDRRHVPRSILDRVRDPTFLPDGFIAYCCLIPEETHRISLGSLDTWLHTEGYQRLGAIPQTQRMKCAFQYDRLVIGCAWVTRRKIPPLFLGVRGIHHVLHSHRARYREYTAKEESYVADPGLPHDRPESFLQLTLACSLGAREDRAFRL